MREHGARSYVEFLWFFKQDTLQRVFIEDQGRNAFYPDVYYYTATGYRPILRDPRLEELLYPTRFGLVFLFLANVAAALAFGFSFVLKKPLWLVPISLILAAYPQAVLVWIGDVNDIPRHSVGHNILLRLGFWMLVLFVLDTVMQSLKPLAIRGWAAVAGRVSCGVQSADPSRSWQISLSRSLLPSPRDLTLVRLRLPSTHAVLFELLLSTASAQVSS